MKKPLSPSRSDSYFKSFSLYRFLWILSIPVFCNTNAFSQSGEETLELDLNITHVACFGLQTGSINLTVGGTEGIPPYHYQWSNEMTTEDITGLASGYYEVFVTDEYGHWGRTGISLAEPEPVEFALTAFQYGDGNHVSCHFCNDGSIDLEVGGGTSPYTFQWTDGDITQSRTNLSARPYQVIITDANGCQRTSETVTLVGPERDDWRMTGNEGSNPSTDFIGTSDSTDFVLRSNNMERLRITKNGILKLNGTMQVDSASTDSTRLVYADHKGMLKIWPSGPIDPVGDPVPCVNLTTHWRTDYCGGNPDDIFNIPSSGNVGIGTITPINKLDIYGSVAVGSGYAGNNTAPQNGLIVEGNVGISTINPHANFQIGGSLVFNTDENSTQSNPSPSIGYNFYQDNTGAFTGINSQRAKSAITFDYDGSIIFKGAPAAPGSFTWNNSQTRIFNDGRVYIGDGTGTGHNYYHPDYSNTDENYFLLTVEGKILGAEIKVKNASTWPWPDYVFAPDYKLPTIEQAEEFIKENGRLADMPSAEKIKEDGHNLGEMDASLLKKIEELTLYVIDLNKTVKAQAKEIKDLKSSLNR